jgi:regulatory protein
VATRRRRGSRIPGPGRALEEDAERASGQPAGGATGRTAGAAGHAATDGASDPPVLELAGTPGPLRRGTGGRGTQDRGGQREGLREPEAAARETCLRLLTAAPRTRAQLAGALRRRGVPESVADQVLGRFAETGLIDDAAFASAWVESRHYSRGLSRRALAAELRQRGVADDDVRDAVSELDPQQEAATARRLVNAKLAATRGQPPRVRTRRLAGMLARKGYPAGLVFRIVREAFEAEGIDAAEAGLDESAEAAFEGADPWPDGAEPG